MRNLIECNNVIPHIFAITDNTDTDEIISKQAALWGVSPAFITRLVPEKEELTVEQIKDLFTIIRLSSTNPSLIAIHALDVSSSEVQNMLLKTLEEISVRYHFVLFVRYPDKLLPTIRSRCILVSSGAQASVPVAKRHISVPDYFSFSENSDLSREAAIKKIDDFLLQDPPSSLNFVKQILSVRSLLMNNNVDPSMGLDSILLFYLKTGTMKNVHATT